MLEEDEDRRGLNNLVSDRRFLDRRLSDRRLFSLQLRDGAIAEEKRIRVRRLHKRRSGKDRRAQNEGEEPKKGD